MSTNLTFQQFREANRTRCLRWHPEGIGSWSDSDWMTAIVGELGELAGLIKMRNRERDGYAALLQVRKRWTKAKDRTHISRATTRARATSCAL